MKLQYLGTAAAEGISTLFCNCPVCTAARQKQGREIKTRSQALLDDTLLIDFPADTYMHALKFGIDLPSIRTLLITHCHADHLYERDFWCRNANVAHGIGDALLDVFATAAGCEKIKAFDAADSRRTAVHEITPFVPFEAAGYRIIPLKADHDPATDPVFFIIEKGDKTLLYAHDTGWFPAETRAFLESYGRKFDCVSLDCTCMLVEYREGHMGLATCRDVFAKLTEMGLCDATTVACVNHFSHNGNATHAQFEKEAARLGFLTAYDGMTVEF